MEKGSKQFFYDPDREWEEVWPGIERKIIGYNDTLMQVKVKFRKGTVAPEHNHPHSQSAYIVSGKFEVTLGGKTKVMEAGDGFFVPPGVMHGVTALEAGIVIDAFSPHREDFVT